MFIKLKDHKVQGSVYDHEEDKKEINNIKSISPHLKDEVIDVDNFTVEDLMNFLFLHENEVNIIFYSSTNGHKIRPFYEDLSNERDRDGFSELLIKWDGKITEHEDEDLKKHSEFSIFPHVSGVKKNKEFAIDFVPLGELKNANIRLDRSLYVYDIHNSIFPKKDFYCGERSYTLGDVIDAFLNEITFNGYPETRKERYEEMVKRVEESKKDVENGRTYTMDEVKLSFLYEKYNRSIKKGKKDVSNTLKERIDDLEKKILDEKGKINKPPGIFDD